MVTDPKTIEAIYRMSHEQKLSGREIARFADALARASGV